MAATPAKLDVTGAERYNPDKLAQLEAYVDQQVVNSTYQLDANLALLRLYQFSPEKINLQKLLRLLVKALMQLPAPDFNTCLCLVPESVQEEESVRSLVAMAGHLQACRFKDFWAAVETQRDLLNSVPGFYDAVRSYALHVLGATFQRVSKATLMEVLKLEGMGLDTLIVTKCKSGGWAVAPESSGGVIILPKTEHNQPRAKQVEGTKYEGISKVIKMTPVA
mmetsp:Transcript_556/g.1447  ORF Transcript_556/g.1447 Transcript_556/m.1447 type:complete len:222 (+) Transcript_556:101-766(+)